MFGSVSNKKDKNKTSESSFVFLFNEIIKNILKELDDLKQTEKIISSLGKDAGKRLFVFWMFKSERLEDKIIPALQTIGNIIWKIMFDKKIDSIEMNNEKEYMLIENEPTLTKFFSPTKEFLSFNPSCYFAGVIEGFLSCAETTAFVVSAHLSPIEEYPMRTVFLIKQKTSEN